MKMQRRIKFGMFLLVGVLLISFISADYMRSNTQYTQFDSKKIFPKFDKSMCEAGQDFIIQIAPFGCTPAVVRSDLLEEQNVPVFCQLAATKINPLIDVEAIESISFPGKRPKEVQDIGFHPARAALGIKENLNSPILNNIGYVVILLKKQKNASAMPEFVQGDLTAKIKYDIKNAFGIGKANFYLPELTDEQWEDEYIRIQYGFWDGRGYLRAEAIDDEEVIISIYTDTGKISSVSLKKGETSKKIYMPGFDCLAGLELKLDDIENPATRARLRVNGDVVEIKKGGRFLENKCQVKNLENKGLSQKVTIKCSGEKAFDLKIEPQVNLSIDGVEKKYKAGDWLYDTKDLRSVYLGFIGTYDNTEKREDLYVYFVEMKKKNELSEGDISDVGSLVKLFTHERTTGIAAADILKTVGKAYIGAGVLIQKLITKGMNINYLSYTYLSESGKIEITSPQDISGKKVSIIGYAESPDKEIDDKDYYENAMEDYETIMDSFSSIEYFENEKITSGEEALYKKILLARDTEQKRAVVELCKEFKERYSNSGKNLREYCDNEYKLSSSEIASRSVMISGKLRKISFEGIYEPGLDEYSVEIFIKGAGKNYTGLRTLQKDEKRDVSESEFISLKELGDDYAVFDVSNVDVGVVAELTYKPEELKINLKDYKIIGKNKYQIRVDKIKLKKIAKVSVIPNIDNVGTEANFSFKIGIEKRAIKLSPEKTKEMIEELNKTIEQWTEISEGLRKVLKGLKGACLGVGAMLTIKNLFANTGGKAIARQEVMRGKGGWYERCADLVSDGTYSSQEQCMVNEAGNIDKDVDMRYKNMQEQNNKFKELEKGISTKKFLSETHVDTVALMKNYYPIVRDDLVKKGEITDPIGKGSPVDVSETSNIYKVFNVDKQGYSLISLNDARQIQLELMQIEDGDKSAQERLYSKLSEIQAASGETLKLTTLSEELTKKGLKNVRIRPFADERTKIEVYDGATVSKGRFGRMEEGTPIQVITYHNKEYVLKLELLENNQYQIDKVYETDGSVSEKEEEMKNLYAYFKKYDRTSYQNKFKSSSGETVPIVRYYETEPYKGLPGVVPFDLNNGWYSATKPTLPLFGSIRAYDESGRVTSFYLCNVGSNGIEEFRTVGDDICEMVNLGTGQPYNQFPGLEGEEALKRVGAGVKAIEQASRQYKSGVSRININVGYGDFNLKVGSPAVDIPDMQCQDFMSPKDCQLLFNVCDPVICPSSRCDFGGAYPVKDVIQSGIIGSIALCLPNFKEGIYIPVCLTGIKAGIDGLLSIQTSYRDCLQNSLDTGEMVGICDEIYSIYMCEFLWRQALPLAKIAIPKMMEWMLGQNVRGGGEYLGVASAWDNADKSVTYFTQYYAANSFNAFKARTAEEAGGEFCKMYVSGVYPEGGNLLDSLTEPDSPPQFHGRFDEIPFTSATVPPISHYKVFYHIFAGKDSGVYYRVYLKGVPESSFYQDVSSARIVASGYISVGGYASETKDFTAPSGYKEMCIMVNHQEECGFKQVSTDFAVNYIKDEYIASQARETDIKTATECIAGSASAYSLLTPNIQGAAEEIVNPAIYNKGIIRICATDNPGKGTDAYVGGEGARWVEAGYCDNKKMKCWLDTKSVKNVIRTTTTEEDVLEDVSKNQLEILRNKEGYLSEDDSLKVIDDVEKLIKGSEFEEAIDKVDDNFDKVFLNSEKANLLFLRGNAYGELARIAAGIVIEKATAVPDETSKTDEKENGQDAESEVEKETSVSYKIWEKVKSYEDIKYDHFRTDQYDREVYDKVCASFVVKVLNEAGVKPFIEEGLGKGDDASYLLTKFEERNDFVEVYSDELEKGDIVIFSQWYPLSFNNIEHVGIFSEYENNEKDKVRFYSDFGGGIGRWPVELKTYPIKGTFQYFYRAFRYIGDSEDEIGKRDYTWEIDYSADYSALKKIDALLKNKNYGGKATYSSGDEIKRFINELCDDEVLTKEECRFHDKSGEKSFKTKYRKDEINIEDLKTLLKEKQITKAENHGDFPTSF